MSAHTASGVNVLSTLPVSGPLTGGTQVTVVGVSFANGTNIRVRFGTVSVAGTFVSTTAITCIAPDISASSDVSVSTDVTVALNGQQFTTSSSPYLFYGICNCTSISVIVLFLTALMW
jgi:hypothetical protein